MSDDLGLGIVKSLAKGCLVIFIIIVLLIAAVAALIHFL